MVRTRSGYELSSDNMEHFTAEIKKELDDILAPLRANVQETNTAIEKIKSLFEGNYAAQQDQLGKQQE